MSLRFVPVRPTSGAYHMTGKDQQRQMFEPYGHQAYLPYLITSMDRAYPEMWDGDIYEVFVPPYDSLLRATMTGEYSIGYVSKRLRKSLLMCLTHHSSNNIYKIPPSITSCLSR